MASNRVLLLLMLIFNLLPGYVVAQSAQVQLEDIKKSDIELPVREPLAALVTLVREDESSQKGWHKKFLRLQNEMQDFNQAEKILLKILQAHYALDLERHDDALFHAKAASAELERISTKQASSPNFYFLHQVTANIYASQKLFKKAFDEKTLMVEKINANWDITQKERLEMLEQKYQLSLKEKTHQLLAGEQAIQDLQFKNTKYQERAQIRNILLFIVLSTAFAILLYRQLKVRKKLSLLTETDGLTKLYNRRSFFLMGEDRFSLALAQGTSLSVIMADIDHFKQINDTFGHDIGDKVIVEVALLGKESFRTRDIYARIGGEEFAVILPETPLKEAHAVAERFREKVQESKQEVDGKQHSITISIGVATLSSETSDFESLLHQADQAMYKAKQQGRNQVVC